MRERRVLPYGLSGADTATPAVCASTQASRYAAVIVVIGGLPAWSLKSPQMIRSSAWPLAYATRASAWVARYDASYGSKCVVMKLMVRPLTAMVAPPTAFSLPAL